MKKTTTTLLATIVLSAALASAPAHASVENNSGPSSKEGQSVTETRLMNDYTVGDLGDDAKEAGKKTWEFTKKAGSKVADLGSKTADRIRNACWFNCESAGETDK